eukprot:766401-Hanusia_phi.AAC.2
MVLTIYASRTNDKRRKTAKSEEVAKDFGVTAKAIRDIWNRRTWWNVTQVLWTEEERLHHERTWKPSARLPGRPRGSKDSKPRKTRRKIFDVDASEEHISSSATPQAGERRLARKTPPEVISLYSLVDFSSDIPFPLLFKFSVKRNARENRFSDLESEEQEEGEEGNSSHGSTDDESDDEDEDDDDADMRDEDLPNSAVDDRTTRSQRLRILSKHLCMQELFQEALTHVLQR